MTILITGGGGGGEGGFIGSNFVHTWLEKNNEPFVNLDLLTYAGNLENLQNLLFYNFSILSFFQRKCCFSNDWIRLWLGLCEN